MAITQKKRPDIEKEDLSYVGIIIEKVKSLQYGKVEITVHDWVVTRIETTDRLHLDKKHPVPPAEDTKSAPSQ
jgi:hypothetical protein